MHRKLEKPAEKSQETLPKQKDNLSDKTGVFGSLIKQIVGIFKPKTPFDKKLEEYKGRTTLLGNGEVLLGDISYSFPNDYSRDDEISFDGVVLSPEGETKYKRLVAVFLNNKQYPKREPREWIKGVWDNNLKSKVIAILESISDTLSPHESKVNAKNLIQQLKSEVGE